MGNIIATIRALPMLSHLVGASNIAVTDAALQLRVEFSDEYKEYLLEFGAISADGIELTGITKATYCNVVAVTKREWELNNLVPHTMYVIENTGVDGKIIWQDNSGTVYLSSPGNRPHIIADSLNSFIQARMK